MIYQNSLHYIDGLSAVRAVNETLRRIDERLMDHGARVAYIAQEIADEGNLSFDRKTLHLLCDFHDIGAYKTDEIDRMVEFETHDVYNHSVYGYLFLKYLTPLDKQAEGILYHHTPWDILKKSGSEYAEYAALIHLADRIDIAAMLGTDEQINNIIENQKRLFCPEYTELFRKRLEKSDFLQNIRDGSYKKTNEERILQAHIAPDEAVAFLKMIAYSIDFRSEYTVTHTYNTVSIALNLAKHFGMSEIETEAIYLGALLHDVGKIAIPLDILEYPGKLSPEKMEIMRTHVDETEKLLSGVIPDNILQIAIRHHEKLDGSGYPRGLTARDLDTPQRIVAIADIVSALTGRRSYKEPFPKEKTIEILSAMAEKQLDKSMCDYFCNDYDSIMQENSENKKEFIGKYQSIVREYKELSKNKLNI